MQSSAFLANGDENRCMDGTHISHVGAFPALVHCRRAVKMFELRNPRFRGMNKL